MRPLRPCLADRTTNMQVTDLNEYRKDPDTFHLNRVAKMFTDCGIGHTTLRPPIIGHWTGSGKPIYYQEPKCTS